MVTLRHKIIGFSMLAVLLPVLAGVVYLRATLVYVVNGSHSLPEAGYAMFTWPKYRSIGTIVAFHVPDEINRGFPFVKRIAGIAGDTITFEEGQVCINGTCLRLTQEEPYFKTATAPQIIPEGQVFVMGDTANSFDSRYAALGLIGEDQIIAGGFALPFAPEWEGRN